MKTILALILTIAASSANAAFVFVKPAPVSCVGSACTIATAIKAPVPPSGGAPTAPVAPTPAPAPTPAEPAPFNASLLVNQTAAVAKAAGACFHKGNNVESAEALAVAGSNGALCLGAAPTPQADAVSGYSWSVSQNYVGRTWTQAFQVRTVNAQTGASTWTTKLVAGAPTSTEYRNLSKQWVSSNGADVYPDGAQFAAYTYTATLTGVRPAACTAVAAAKNPAVTCSGGTVTAQYAAAAFSSVGTVSAGAASLPAWAAATVAYPR